jgi:hypothetical protein
MLVCVLANVICSTCLHCTATTSNAVSSFFRLCLVCIGICSLTRQPLLVILQDAMMWLQPRGGCAPWSLLHSRAQTGTRPVSVTAFMHLVRHIGDGNTLQGMWCDQSCRFEVVSTQLVSLLTVYVSLTSCMGVSCAGRSSTFPLRHVFWVRLTGCTLTAVDYEDMGVDSMPTGDLCWGK